MSPLYTRTTRACPVSEIDPAYAEALRGFAEKHGIEGDPFAGVVASVATRSVKRKGLLDRVFGRDTDQVCFAFLTADWLFTVNTDPKSGAPIPYAHRVREMEAADYEKTPAFQRVPDSGLEITAFAPQASRRTVMFLGLGAEPAAVTFREALQSAV